LLVDLFVFHLFSLFLFSTVQFIVLISVGDISERFQSSHVVFQELRTFLLGDLPAVEWCQAAERAIEAIFTISENPDQLLAAVIKEYSM
jgi:hypothetical protein